MTVTFNWRIENLYSCYSKVGQCIKSPVFTTESFGGSWWQLEFYPQSQLTRGYSHCNFLRIMKGTVGDITVDYEMAITVTNCENLYSFKIKRSLITSKNNYYSKNHQIPIVENVIKNCDDILTISVTFITCNPICHQVSVCEATTKMAVNRCSFLWNVPEPDPPKWFQTIKCPVPDICPIEITLTSADEYISMDIRLLEEKQYVCRLVTGKIALLDMEGIERHSKSYKLYLENETVQRVWHFPSFIEINLLNSNKDNFLNNKVFSLMCYLISSTSTNSDILNLTEEMKYTNEIPVNSRIDNFSTVHLDVSAMLNDQIHSDVNLQTGSEVFSCHKFILAARSPVFYAMFKKKETAESQTGVVDIPDVDARTLKSFLEFLYTDTVSDMGYESSSKLLIAADKYQVVSLREKCASFLTLVLSVENVCDVLSLADLVGHNLLKKSAIDYIKIHADKILLTSEWCTLIKNNCQLVSEVLYTFSAILKNAN